MTNIENGLMQALVDRTAISDIVYAYATAVDTRNWPLLRSLFTDRIDYDFRTFSPDLFGEVSADEIVERSKVNGNFDATQHISSNHTHTIDGDRATCVSYMQASHFLKRPDANYHCTLYGYYTKSFIRSSDGWKINQYSLSVTGQTGDPRIFEWVGF